MRNLRPGTAVFLLALLALCARLGAAASTTKASCSCIRLAGISHRTTRSWLHYVRDWPRVRASTCAVYDATLDAEQVSEYDDLQPLLELLRNRFAGSPPDVVVTIGPPAARFYLKNRDKVFPGTPVVISALDQQFVDKSALRARDCVVAIHQHLPRLVDNILRVLPDTQTIVVVLRELAHWERVRLGDSQGAHAICEPGELRVAQHLSLEQMRQRLATLPAHSAVLYTLMVTDAAGVPQQRGAALASLFEVSTAPIFSLYESELGHGVVGGPYHSQQRGGALTAAATLSAMSGQITADPVIQLVDYEAPVYDWRELKRWNIDFARLPAGSEIRFQPASLWDDIVTSS